VPIAVTDSPTPIGQIGAIILFAARFFDNLLEAGMVDGVPSPLSPKGSLIRKAMILYTWSEWEGRMNPHKSQSAGPCIDVRGWQLPLQLQLALAELCEVRTDFIRRWGLEPLLGASGISFRTVPPGGEGKGLPALAKGFKHIDKPIGWPSPIPHALWHRANYSLQRLRAETELAAHLIPSEPDGRKGAKAFQLGWKLIPGLTSTECDILNHLWRNGRFGRVARSELCEAVYDEIDPDRYATLHKHVNNLKKKLFAHTRGLFDISSESSHDRRETYYELTPPRHTEKKKG
jgi:hypothetical protein